MRMLFEVCRGRRKAACGGCRLTKLPGSHDSGPPYTSGEDEHFRCAHIMAKGKSTTGVPNRHLHARISYLQQAATYLTAQARTAKEAKLSSEQMTLQSIVQRTRTHDDIAESDQRFDSAGLGIMAATMPRAPSISLPQSGGLPLHLASHLKQIALKSQIHLHTNVKHTICRTCCTVLVDGETCTKRMENLSLGGMKPHADVLVMECTVCSAAKRFPVSAERQKRKGQRACKHLARGLDQPAERSDAKSVSEAQVG